MKGNFSNDIQFSPDGRHLAFVFGNVVHIHSFPSMKLTHSYNPTNSQFAITKLQWHPNPDKLQLYTCDMQRNIALFDYILNKVIASSVTSDGGTEFCLANNGETLIAINNLQIKVYASRNLELRYTIVTEEFMESLHSIDNHIYLGGQET
jgi:WD40 repeat protein